jgi:hypothetical protein
VLLYPFALGIMGQWGKKPAILFILLLMSISTVAIMYVTFRAIYPSDWSEIATSLGKQK